MPSNGSSWPSMTDLTKDTWMFEAEWGSRPDDPAGCTERLLACLAGVAATDPSLAQWFYDDEPLPLDRLSIERRVAANWDRETPTGERGTSVSLWNGVRDDLAVATFSVGCGASAPYLRNRVELVPPRPAAAPGLFQLDRMLGLFEAVVAAWQPTWCRVRPRSLRKAAARGATHGTVDVLASWIVYLDRSVYVRSVELPSGVGVLGGVSGEAFVLAPTPERLRLGTIGELREHITFPGDEHRLG